MRYCVWCWIRLKFLHKVIYYIVVNLPFFVVRLVIWHLHDKHVSVFLVKNILGMGLAVQHLHEVLVEMSQIIKSDVHADDTAAAGEPGTSGMRKLTPDDGADKATPAETCQLAEIHS